MADVGHVQRPVGHPYPEGGEVKGVKPRQGEIGVQTASSRSPYNKFQGNFRGGPRGIILPAHPLKSKKNPLRDYQAGLMAIEFGVKQTITIGVDEEVGGAVYRDDLEFKQGAVD